ncbi:gustatory receptor 68a-like [Diabrotica virgifera virgifera]|uniref:Gustatory receptor n=1 Tax=Diabrotica virgifera virgifera TaxID=50390 RepID=A0ABM5JQW7_DIAVI|nr:gustatory receptor 68a-like [Diabrotica virgifera virgifera]
MFPNTKNFYLPITLSISLQLAAVVPPYDFKNQKLKQSNLFKGYSIFLSCLVIATSVIFGRERFLVFLAQHSTPMKILDLLNEFFGIVMFLVTTLGANFWNTNEWCTLYQKLSNVPKTNICKNKGCLTTNTVFVLSTIFVGISQGVFYYVWGSTTVLVYVSYSVHYYIGMLLSFEIHEVTKSITKSYYFINKSLSDLQIKGIECHKVKILKLVEEQYQELFQIVNHFNNVFGWSILTVLFNNGILLLSTITFMTSIGQTKIDLSENDMRGLYIANAVFTCVWPVIIIFSCDFTKNEAQKILINCSSLHKTMLLPEEVLALNSFENKVYTNLPKFTAAGFFEITRNTLLQFISSLTSYLIILIQLR